MERKGLEEGRYYYVPAHKDREEDRFVYIARGERGSLLSSLSRRRRR
jgi:hypothetical protein